ncbi:hypothetical protein B0A55_07793 [Friedmanniomyces simplex]|uniref:F-box domain-containing protein n=1 Tax=Friedmanniomyces simplex TaxID=329884 RepID=A0A4U0X4X0_9PEZI|nr:hypothetical protein B0A55_07793 [Friedmanniomyces simplex]
MSSSSSSSSDEDWDEDWDEERDSSEYEEVAVSDEENDQTFPLFELPPELWVRICRFAVMRDAPTMLEPRTDDFRSKVCQPAITRICRDIRKETLGCFYANSFVYKDRGKHDYAEYLVFWLGKLSDQVRSNLLNLVIRSKYKDVEQYFSGTLKAVKVQLLYAGVDEKRVKLFKVVPLNEED